VKKRDVLPASLAPRGLCRVQAAAYVGVSPGLFDAMVMDARMPPPKTVNSRKIWDRRALDLAFDALPEAGGHAVIEARQSAADGWEDYSAHASPEIRRSLR
jgi:hypothetical protein